MLDLSLRQQQWETKGLQGFWDPLQRDVIILVVTVIGWGLKSTSIMTLFVSFCLFTNKWFKYLNGSMFLQRLRLFWLSKYVKLSVSNPGHDKFDQWGWKSRNVVEMLKGKEGWMWLHSWESLSIGLILYASWRIYISTFGSYLSFESPFVSPNTS